jgi:Mo-co oxidoreductase dimerisation domain
MAAKRLLASSLAQLAHLSSMLSDIEVLAKPDANYWTATAYRIPDTPRANIKPGDTDVNLVPINRMVPRSFITNPADGASVHADSPTLVRGIAFGGDTGVARVHVSPDAGATWHRATLGPDHGKYSFRQWAHANQAGPSG